MKFHCLIGILLLLGLTGCAKPGSFTNTMSPASEHNVVNEKYVETDPAVVWDQLVGEISKSYFMINNIDKGSRIINISYASNEADDYVDCGTSVVNVQMSSLNKIGRPHYDIVVCDANELVIETGALNQGGIMAPIICENKRRPTLEGRMNIYVAPQGSGTLVTVNSRYIVTIKLSSVCHFYAPAGNLVQSKDMGNTSYVCSLDSKRPELCEAPDGKSFMCRSKGRLEEEILSLIN